jgi:membrane protein
MKQQLKTAWTLLKETLSSYSDNRIAKLSGSLAYFTVFSMGPLLVVVLSLAGIFLSREAIEGRVFEELVQFVGTDTAAQLQEIIKNAAVQGNSRIAAIIGMVTLVIGATTVFAEIQDSINQIWGIKPKPKLGILLYLKNRFLSFSVVVGLGFLLLVSLSVSALIEALNSRLQLLLPGYSVWMAYIINLLLSVGISAIIFATIFRVLPDARISWKDVRVGAFSTALLFLAGKFAISIYISQTKVGSTFGAAGSLVVLLVWIYYSSVILYLGAAFTKVYALRFGQEIIPNDYAVTIKREEIETEAASIQENEEQGTKP